MKKTLAKRLLAVAMMVCMVLAMALPASAVYKYVLKLEITEEKPTVKESAGEPSKVTVTAESSMLTDTELAEQLYLLLLTKYEGKKGVEDTLWDFKSDTMGMTIAAGLRAYRESDEAWITWLGQFTSDDKGEVDGEEDLVTLIQQKKKISALCTGKTKTCTMYYQPLDVPEGDPAYGNKYIFTLTVERSGSSGSGGGTVTPSTPSDPVTPTPTPGTTTGTVVEVPEATTPDEVVTLPVEEVKVGEDTQVTVNTKSETPVKVVIPVAETTSGTVAVLIKEDGTEQIIRDSVITEDGVMASVSDGDKIVIKDNTKTFNDVTDAHWGKDAVTFVAARGIFAGTGDGTTFSPDVETTRGMIAQVLHNLNYNVENHLDGHDFNDVQDHHWYDEAVHWAEDHGIVGGYPDGSFQGDKNVSREELVVMLWNYAGKQASEDDSHVDAFNDAANVSDWAKAAMNWALENGILGGKGGKMLDPTGMATRAELAQMIKNFCANK